MLYYNKLMSANITIIVQNQTFVLARDILAIESHNKQIKSSKDFTLPMPEWVTKPIYFLIEKYLKTRDVNFLMAHINDNDTIVKLLRTADYLGMGNFHDKFINEILIPNINHRNCLTLLEQSHKKLKNIDNSQTWYNLLNMTIIYLSAHVFDVFKMNPMRFKSLNQKIINEIFQRVIRLQKKNDFNNRHMLYQLIMECKQSQIGQASKLFEVLRTNLKAKKIHSKIHAKLSWKLENIPQLNQKNTKNFKYLEMNWFLKAQKQDKGLLVTLNLLSFDELLNSDEMSESSQKSQKSLQVSNKSLQDKNQNEQLFRNDTFTKIGVFYSKVHWKFQDQTFQQQTKIHYILMNEQSAMQVILVDKFMENMVGKEKVELTIFCNIQIIYTFLLNYVFWHFDSLIFRGPNFSREQLMILVRACKRVGNYLQALKIVADLLSTYPSEIKNSQIHQGFNFSKMTKTEIDIYSTIFSKKISQQNFHKQKDSSFISIESNSRLSHLNQNTTQANLQNPNRPVPIQMTPTSSLKRGNFHSSSSQLSIGSEHNNLINTPYSNVIQQRMHMQRISSGIKVPTNSESLGNSRDTRGLSKKKIFSQVRESGKKDILMQQMIEVTDLSLYLNDPMSPQSQKLGIILKI